MSDQGSTRRRQIPALPGPSVEPVAERAPSGSSGRAAVYPESSQLDTQPTIITKIENRLGWLDTHKTIDLERLKKLQASVKNSGNCQCGMLSARRTVPATRPTSEKLIGTEAKVQTARNVH